MTTKTKKPSAKNKKNVAVKPKSNPFILKGVFYTFKEGDGDNITAKQQYGLDILYGNTVNDATVVIDKITPDGKQHFVVGIFYGVHFTDFDWQELGANKMDQFKGAKYEEDDDEYTDE